MKDFVGFDWGSAEANMEHHGQETPPQYILENVNTQVKLIINTKSHSFGDFLQTSSDLISF